jgi:hypothetical protein
MAKNPSNSLPELLMVTYGGGHVRMVLPVAKALEVAGKVKPRIVALTTAAPVVRAAGFEALGFADLIDPNSEADAHALELGRELAAGLPTPPVDANETAAYMGLSFQELLHELGEPEARRRYRQYGRQAFSPKRSMLRMLQRLKPAAVLATNSPRAERAAIWAAGESGIPSACLVDLFAIDESAWIAKEGFASRVMVLNEAVRQRLIAQGRKPDEVVATGNPAFDSLNDAQWREQAPEVRHQMLAPTSGASRVLLYASSVPTLEHPFHPGLKGNPELFRQVARELKLWRDHNPQWTVWVKPHPGQAAAFGDEFEGLPVCAAQWPLHAQLQAVDAVVVIDSTVAVEATLAGRPVVRVLGSLFDDATPFEALGFARASCAVGELTGALDQVLRPGSVSLGHVGQQTSRAEPATSAVVGELHRLLGVDR